MHDGATLGATTLRAHAPGGSGCGDEHLARISASSAKRLIRFFDAPAAARMQLHVLEHAAGLCLLNANRRPVDLELFGDHHRQNGTHALTHLEPNAPDCDDAVWRDAKERFRA